MPPAAVPDAATALPSSVPPGKKRSSSEPFAALPPLRLHAFEGPLDLLLHLVRAGRMDIFDLPIATLCDQYIAHLDALGSVDLSVAGEFLVMAATLLEIKSRLLLPVPPRDDADPDQDGSSLDLTDPRAELVQRLLEYGKYQAIAEGLKLREADRKNVFFRDPMDARLASGFALPPKFGELSADDLLRTLERMLASVGAGEKAITSVRRQKITLRMKMREVAFHARQAGQDGVSLSVLVPNAPFALIEVVLLFLALLELLKSGSVLVAQKAFCGDIRIFFVPEFERAMVAEGEIESGTEGIEEAEAED
ncbi:MAG: segregation/condensation protein A [Cytophagales bacterium]|nr:segregation/condensation protein A [Armatimonadota bacterium]